MGPDQKLDLGQLQNRQLLVAGTVFKGYIHHTLAELQWMMYLLLFPNMNSLNGEASPRATTGFAELMC